MCRISGIIDPTKSIEELISSIKEINSILSHGGPDGEGVYISEEKKLVFGHRRLALLDLTTAGHQPMAYQDGKYQITYNGEIYNYPELKKELEDIGFSFKSLCDTEMILVAFDAWGTNAFARFNGMFAFCLLDNTNNNVYLVRDSNGIKPVYYYQQNRKFYFASEIKAFKIFPDLNKINQKARVLFLAFGHLPEPVTTLEKIAMLPKGTFLSFNLETGENVIHNFRRFEFEEQYHDQISIQTKLNDQLTDSVKHHLLSDAPIGVFLSGGIDSSIIALLAHQFSGSNLNTLSLYFNEQKYSEKKYQDLIINTSKCKHSQYLLTGEEFSKYFENVVHDMDLPSIDGINTWFISKYAKESGLKAVLSGVGSDELFGGYPSFRRMKLVKILRKFPPFLLKLSRLIPNQKIQRISFLALPGVVGEYLFLRGQFTPKEISTVLMIPLNDVVQILNEVIIKEQINILSPQNQVSWIELNMYMQNQLLRDSDVMSMAHGLEIRVPFLSEKFVEFCLKINSNQKYSGRYPKQILIDSFKDLLPRAIWERPKMGFTFPFRDWMKDNEFVLRNINSSPIYKKLYEKFQKGALSWNHIMSIIVMNQKINE